ncbi:MAG TPA: sulfotransferase domain-containing protein [Chthoniobacterales bacterium]
MEPDIFIYQHLPKCGGRSFIHQCKEWFHTAHENPGSYPSKEQVAAFAESKLDFDALPRPCLVHGHLIQAGIRPCERYAAEIAAGKCRVVTIVRDPLERRISAYFHRARKGRPWPDSLEHWMAHTRNNLASYLGVTAETWRARLDDFFLVGTTEELQLTINLMAAKTGHPPVPAPPHLNPSPRSEYEIAPAAIEKFRVENALDYDIHRYAVERLHREAAAAGLA